MRWRIGAALLAATLALSATAAGQGDNPYRSDEKKGSEKKDDDGGSSGDAADTPDEKPAAAPPPKPKPKKREKPVEAAPETRAEAMRAYVEALKKRKLAATQPLSRARLRAELEKIEAKLFDGRRDEAIGDLVYFVESPRFDAFAESDEGRAARFLLGDALGRAGAYGPARGYLRKLLSGKTGDTWYRRAVRSLVDFGLESGRPNMFLKDLRSVSSKSLPEELRGDIAYLRGRDAELKSKPARALSEFGKVTPRSRFWAQAVYRSGLIQVQRKRFKKAENLFCKIADPKLTPRTAPLFGGSDFFRVRDQARLALGRIAHEQFRFDDSTYYYYLVPKDSDALPEALYESATSRYEAKDYAAASELLRELRALQRNHAYQDEVWVLDAFVDMAACNFPSADAKLKKFIATYEPIRNAARSMAKDRTAVRRLVDAVGTGRDPAAAGLGVPGGTARTLGALLRLDAAYAQTARRVAQLDHQMSGLLRTVADLDDSLARMSDPKKLRARPSDGPGGSSADKVQRIEAQLAELRRLLREAKRSGKAKKSQLSDIERDLEALELRARAARLGAQPPEANSKKASGDLADLARKDRERATKLYASSDALRKELQKTQIQLATDALTRVDRRLSRLLRRARLGRIETVLGKKRALEIEIEALSEGLLPRGAVDSLDAERYLRDDEEYWPHDGEDWADEYVGGEGLR